MPLPLIKKKKSLGGAAARERFSKYLLVALIWSGASIFRLITLMEVTTTMEVVGKKIASEIGCQRLDRTNTALSFVYAGRNDNYVGIYNRMKVSIGVLLRQLGNVVSNTKKAEIIIVSWGDDPSRLGIMEEAILPAVSEIYNYSSTDGWDNICVRVIKVPSNYTSDGFIFSEFVAKNIGIRRASGSWIVASNLDNFLSSKLLNFAFEGGQGRLSKNWYLRSMRFNINIQEGSVRWAKGLGYERVDSLPAPVDASSLINWMSIGEDGYSLLEREYEGKQLLHLNQYAKFDKICIDSTESGALEQYEYPNHEYSAAAGDFTMASASAWHHLHGYPEVYDNNHLDGLQLCRFVQAGIQEVILRPNRPCSAFVFHQLHEEGRGGRKERNIGADHGCATEVGIENRISSFVNETGWGHPFDLFEEEILMFKHSVSKFVGVPFIGQSQVNLSIR